MRMETDINDLVGFCPHENLVGQNSVSGTDSIMIGGPVKLRFAGKRHTVAKARVLAAKKVEEEAKEPEQEPVAAIVAEQPVAVVEQPAVEETAAVSTEEAAKEEQPKPAKRTRKSRKKE